ncbi:alpha/beta-hydrolase [Mycena albidolilacea]|uniref:carboxypeptidase C n=1 Tax=Mycena albidolilacea TaxID=1033008 RepID=A0AAD7EVC4_9AGAR|nr:alpha/beta-hydrolase [Mycena albidolilacea]
MNPQKRDTVKLGLKLETSLLPQQRPSELPPRHGRSNRTGPRWLIGCILVLTWFLYGNRIWGPSQLKAAPFHFNITSPKDICPAIKGPAISHSGHIGLKGDSDNAPKRLFFWYFEAEHDAESAPIILTIGGGPGSSGMLNPMWAQGPCVATENATAPNPNRWTEHFNLLALDHPVGVGFSYGTLVNNSRDAAIDAYDFLQKFFRLYPHLSRNKFIISGGSYGGTYVPHIATVIHEQNLALAAGKGHPGAIRINLESMMVSNPMSDPTSHFSWFLQTACHSDVNNIYNASTCAEMYQILPACLDSIRFAEQAPGWSVERRAAAQNICWQIRGGDTHNNTVEDVRKQCWSNDPLGCLPPGILWIQAFFGRLEVREALGVGDQNFTGLSQEVFAEFSKRGDSMQSAYLLYEPLLSAGIRLLHYVGAQDANCNPHGILSFLKLLQSPFQDEFLRAPDVPWPTTDLDAATVRVVGEGAGNMTWILIDGGGHFVAHDQPELVKSIVEHWVENVPFE